MHRRTTGKIKANSRALRILLAATILIGLGAPSARAADWSFFVAPYGWLASIKGTVVANGRETDLDVSFQDLLENTSGAFQLYAEARRNKFFMAFDWTWAILKSEDEGDLANLEVRVDQRLYDFRLGYEVHRRALNESEADDPLALRERTTDIFIGARYFKTEPRFTLSLPVGDPITTVSTDDRWDPFIGFRTGRDLSKRWGFGVRGDIGGFGIGDAAQFTWQVSASFALRASRRIYFLMGYRALGFDTVTGDGDNRNGADLVQHGPTIGGGFAF